MGLRSQKGRAGGLLLYPSTMAQNFWIAIWAFTVCFLVTVGISLVTQPKAYADLKGLVWGVTPITREGDVPWYEKPVLLGAIVLVCCAILNWLFR